MSNLSDDTLRKQIQTQVGSKEKERKILQLTMRELEGVPQGEGTMYRGVGKMFIEQPRAAIDAQHRELEKSLGDDVASLTKKALTHQAKYLEKQVDEANSQLKDIFHAQQRQA